MLCHAVVSNSFVTLGTVACQAPLSMGFSRQEHWSGLPSPPPGDLPDPGIKSMSPVVPALAGRFFITEAHRSRVCVCVCVCVCIHSINNIEYVYSSIIILESFLPRSVGKTIFQSEVLSEMLATDFSRSVWFLILKSMMSHGFTTAGIVHKNGGNRHIQALLIQIKKLYSYLCFKIAIHIRFCFCLN